MGQQVALFQSTAVTPQCLSSFNVFNVSLCPSDVDHEDVGQVGPAAAARCAHR